MSTPSGALLTRGFVREVLSALTSVLDLEDYATGFDVT